MRTVKGFNSGHLFAGRAGSGKSGVLAYAVAWAHENEWVVINIPQGRNWVKYHPDEDGLERHLNGLYIHPTINHQFLSDLAYSNQGNFETMSVNKELYGKCDFTGHHDRWGEPCPREWDPKVR